MKAPLIELSGVEKTFVARAGGRRRVVQALSGISLSLEAGQSLALVGESGSGKTTLARIAVGLDVPSRGDLALGGRRYPRGARALRHLLAGKVQMVFQDPKGSLNPRHTAEYSLLAPLRASGMGRSDDARKRAHELVELVELDPDVLERYPHELSGGQAQRLAIARALAAEPELLVLDEAVASLDVSIQARILRLLYQLKRRLGLSYLFITHDLSTVEVLCERVAVMYLGRIVELGPVTKVLAAPKHPYTRALISAVPRLDGKTRRIELLGEPPSAAHPPGGCAFHPRCYRAEKRCATTTPRLDDGAVDRPCACFFASDSTPSARSPQPVPAHGDSR